ncbi:MAG TPA: alpha/beta fold hydrolase [Deltaproteobacteria bacterium]|nr:alpha/beta fold hydrolase [Deltaproteobacteria bacterium]HPP79589.1 alpha/beta fold hydrolase [Deltaproteobacteria bacterium]
MTRYESDFFSRGKRCSAWLFLPDGVDRPPVVVMAHGLAAEKDFGLSRYAEVFTSRGVACLVFDYRHFGRSEGEPRNLVNPWGQLADWGAAIAHARRLPEVDGGRVALWGTSFSGGHVVVSAARVPGIRAVLAQVPFVDGLATALGFPLSYQVKGLLHGLTDLAHAALGMPPHTVPAVGEPGAFALMNTPECMAGYLALVPEGTTWKNEVPARFALLVSAYRPVAYARKVACPAFVVYARRDSLIPHRSVRHMVSRMRDVQACVLDAGHFDVYTGALFEEVSARQAEFLARHLKP